MVGKVMDDLLYLGLGAVAAEFVDVLTTKYADPRASMNITMLGAKVGKPSVYIPGGTGALALGYAAYQGNKFSNLKDEELVLTGYGIYSLVKTVGKVLAPTAPAAPTASVRFVPGGRAGQILPPQVTGYPKANGGFARGAV